MPASATYGIVLVASVVAPALHRWWLARTLAERLSDPVLPERLMGRGVREGRVLVAACVGLGFGLSTFGVPVTVLACTMMLVLRAAAGFPLRRVLFGETWSFVQCASFHIRIGLAFSGFWFALMVTPAVVVALRDWTGPAAAMAGVAGGLVAWSAAFPAIVRRLTRSRPIDRPDVAEGFMRLVRQTGLGLPRLERVAVGGGSFANAVALPARSHGTILISDTLIERLETRQVLAIVAHEIAHLEQFTPARLRRLAWVHFGLILAAAAAVPWLHAATPAPWPALVLWCWPVAVLVVLDRLMRGRRAHETASDQRAIELTRDPDALVTALTRIHEIARLPRRWDPAFEQRASHPSLARRLQAIRAVAGRPAGTVAESVPIDAAGMPGNAASVVFREDHLEWRDAASTPRTLTYASLQDLRVQIAGDAATLVAADTVGRRWRLPIDRTDLARVQAALDAVDGRLAAPGPGPAPMRSRIASLLG